MTQFDRNIKGIDEGVLTILEEYRFKGNVRELENIIERAVALSESDKLGFADFPKRIFDKPLIEEEGEYIRIKLGTSLKEIEKRMILESLEVNENNRHKTAEDLGITERTLRNKLKEYNQQ